MLELFPVVVTGCVKKNKKYKKKNLTDVRVDPSVSQIVGRKILNDVHIVTYYCKPDVIV